MRYDLNDETITFYLEGDLNSFTSEEKEKEIDEIINNNTFKYIIFDLEKLNYISSAGIRIIARLRKTYDDISLIKVPEDNYDIFIMVGLENIVSIQKA